MINKEKLKTVQKVRIINYTTNPQKIQEYRWTLSPLHLNPRASGGLPTVVSGCNSLLNF